MAEATLTAAETEVTPTEDEAVVSPEALTESTPAPENVEDTSAVDAILEGIASAGTEAVGADGKNATSDEKVPPAAPSEDQIRLDERAKVEAQKRIDGLKWVVTEDAPNKLAALREELSEKGWATLVNEVNRMKGAFSPLLDRAVDVDTNYAPQVHTQGWNAAITQATEQSWDVIKKELGDDTLKAIQDAKPSSWGALLDAGIKAARKGFVPASDYVSKAFTKERLARIEQSLKERGAVGIVTHSLKDLADTGPNTPAARGGSGNQPKDFTEAEAWHASDKWTNAQFAEYKRTHSRK